MLFRSRVLVVVKRIHGRGLSFADLAAAFGAQRLRRCEASMPIEPAAEDHIARHRLRLARQVGKNHLRDVLRHVRIAAEPSERRGIDEVDVAFHQFTKRVFVASLDVIPQQLAVVRHTRFYLIKPAAAPKRTRCLSLIGNHFSLEKRFLTCQYFSLLAPGMPERWRLIY